MREWACALPECGWCQYCFRAEAFTNAVLTALGSDRLPQYAGEQKGFSILPRVLTVMDNFVSGYLAQSVPLALTTCFQRKAQTASVEFGAFPDSVAWLCFRSRSFSSEAK